MAKRFTKLTAMLLSLIMLFSCVSLTTFATEQTDEASSTFPIDKAAEWKTEGEIANVTLSVPGEGKDVSSDIVFIIGNGPESNSGYLVELIHKMLIAVDGTPTKVKIGLVCYGDTTEAETAMGLTEMADVVPGNTVADYRIAVRGNDGSKYTEPLADYMARKEAAWAAWEAENPLLLQDMDYVIAKALEKAEDVTDGINMESALITARDMLAADTTVPAERKHMVLVSTGLTYWFDNDAGNGSTVVGIDTRDAGSYDMTGNGNVDRYVHGNLQWLVARNNYTSTGYGYPIPFGWSYATYWDYITNWVAADGSDYVFTPVDAEGNPVTYRKFMTADETGTNAADYRPYYYNAKGELKQNTNFRYGYVIGKPIDQATASGVYVPYFAGKTNPTGTSVEAQNAAHALNYERAQYESWVIYNQMQTPIGESFETSLRDENGEFITVDGLGYNCYSVVIGQKGSEPTDLWLQPNQIGKGFMDMLAGGEAAVYDSSSTDFFKPIANKILYTCAPTSYVEDFIGCNEVGNFEFIQNPEYVTLTVGGTAYTTAQVETKEGFDFSLAFTAPGAEEPTFWLDYTYGDGKITEKFIWTFGESVSLEKIASLTYKLQLTEKQEEAGEYIVPTNNSATLYPVDSDGNEGEPQLFPVPELKYVVETEETEEKDPPTVTFKSGEASNISFMLIDKTGNVEFLYKVDIEDETSFVIPTEEGKISAVFVKQSTSGMFWFSENVDEDVEAATIACLKDNNPSYKGHNAIASGEGDVTWAFKNNKFVTYTFTCGDAIVVAPEASAPVAPVVPEEPKEEEAPVAPETSAPAEPTLDVTVKGAEVASWTVVNGVTAVYIAANGKAPAVIWTSDVVDDATMAAIVVELGADDDARTVFGMGSHDITYNHNKNKTKTVTYTFE